MNMIFFWNLSLAVTLMGKISPSPGKDFWSREQALPQQKWHGHLRVTPCPGMSLVTGEGGKEDRSSPRRGCNGRLSLVIMVATSIALLDLRPRAFQKYGVSSSKLSSWLVALGSGWREGSCSAQQRSWVQRFAVMQNTAVLFLWDRASPDITSVWFTFLSEMGRNWSIISPSYGRLTFKFLL